MRSTSRVWRCSLSFLAVCSFPLSAAAAEFPDKPVRIIIPTAAGGPSDGCMRTIAPALQKHLGQNVVIENVTGATGNIGLAKVASASADGYTVALPSAGNSANFITRPKRSFDLEGQLVPIGTTCLTAHTLVVSPHLNIKTVAELVKYGKDHPGALTFGSIGAGSSQHLMAEIFAAATGLKLVHVPFRGESAAITEIAAGRVSMAFMAGAKPFIDGGLVVPLATTNAEHWPPQPELQSLRHALPELANVSYNGWSGLMAPRGTPAAAVDKLGAALQAALQDKGVREGLIRIGSMAASGKAADLTRQLQFDTERFKRVIDERKLTFED